MFSEFRVKLIDTEDRANKFEAEKQESIDPETLKISTSENIEGIAYQFTCIYKYKYRRKCKYKYKCKYRYKHKY